MLPGRDGLVKVRASFAGEAEVLVRVGQKVAGGQTLAVVEGEREIERLAVKTGGTMGIGSTKSTHRSRYARRPARREPLDTGRTP